MFYDMPTDKEEKKEYKKVMSNASHIVDEFEGSSKHVRINRDLGRCSDCANLEFAETRWGNYFAKCGYLEIRLNSNDPIEKCNKHKPVGSMDLSDMWNIYTPINISKRKAGF